jgi:hypothetical protein
VGGNTGEQEVLGRTNLPTFPMAMVAIVTSLSDVTIITQVLNNTKPLLCKAENHASK